LYDHSWHTLSTPKFGYVESGREFGKYEAQKFENLANFSRSVYYTNFKISAQMGQFWNSYKIIKILEIQKICKFRESYHEDDKSNKSEILSVIILY
jgi:phosphoglycerol transferase MdoB-like AlkP superfamily enzyme